MTQGHLFRVYGTPQFRNPSLIVGWSQDAGRLGPKVIDFLLKKLGAQDFCQIEPWSFFSLDGVSIEGNIIQFPESKFYSCQEKDLLLFRSEGPSHEHYRFLATVLDIAQQYGKVKDLYTIGGMVSLMAHTSPRSISAVVNQPELKKTLAGYGLETNVEYQTPIGRRPTLSSFLLWVAERRNIAGASLWVEVPFYLSATEDPRACKQVLTILDRKFGLGMDLTELDPVIKEQNKKIEELREQKLHINKSIEMLERGIMLAGDESEKLTKEVTEFLEKRT